MHRRSALGALIAAVAGCAPKSDPHPLLRFIANTVPPDIPEQHVRTKSLKIEPLTEALRTKGFNECNPHDPLGLGPYSPYEHVSWGRMLIPQKGGHTPDFGFDVLVHFHGADPTRKYLVQTARGIALVLIDLGTGGGPYSRALSGPAAFPELKRSIESALKRHCNDERAHIRHLALSSWSAGAVAIEKILEQKQDGFDSVVMLDGLHGAWKQNAPHEQKPESVDERVIEKAVEIAKRAFRGEFTFVLTYSLIDPVKYPSTSVTAEVLLREVGLHARSMQSSDPFGQISALDEKGLHVWGFRGNEEKAHCSQIMHMPRIVGEILEPKWNTPPMDRSVPPTPLPGKPVKRRG